MARPLPVSYYEHERPAPPAPPSRLGGVIKALAWLLLLAAGGGAYWAYYHYELQYALPVERVIHLKDGPEIKARIEARYVDALKIALLPEGQTRYYPLKALAEEDQVFIRHLKTGQTLQYPVRFSATDNKGRIMEINLMARSDDFIKYFLTADNTMHYLPLSQLSETDEGFIKTLPINLTFRYPIEATLVDKNGLNLNARIEGRNGENVKYVLVADSSRHLSPISDWAPETQDLIRLLPANLTDDYPIPRTLVTTQQQLLNVRLLGRSKDLVKFALVSTGNDYLYPLSLLSADDKAFIAKLPVNLTVDYPFETTLTDRAGRAIPVRLEARTADSVNFTSLIDHTLHQMPLAQFSDTDQAVLRTLPIAVGIMVDTPQIQSLRVKMLSLDANIVGFSNRFTNTALPLSQRELARADLVRAQNEMGRTLNELMRAAGGTDLRSYLNGRLEKLRQELSSLEGRVAVAKGSGDQSSLQAAAKRDSAEIDALVRQIHALDSQPARNTR